MNIRHFQCFFHTSPNTATTKSLDCSFLFKDNLQTLILVPELRALCTSSCLANMFVSDLEISIENLVVPSEISRLLNSVE